MFRTILALPFWWTRSLCTLICVVAREIGIVAWATELAIKGVGNDIEVPPAD